MFKNKKQIFVIIFIIVLLTAGGYKILADELSPLQNLQNVIYLIENYYVEDKNLDELIDAAIDGMLNELDPYSYYLSPEEYEEMQIDMEGEFGGIGIVITVRDEKLTIVSPIKNTPGDKADLKAGDIIKAVDGHLTSEMSQQKAVDMMRGEPGTKVILTISREDVDKDFKVEITRDNIEVPNVEYNMETDNIGYLAIYQFANDVGVKTNEAIRDLKSQGAEAIILDLRSNPGGILEESIKVASNFIQEGEIVSVKNREGVTEAYNVDQEIKATDLPMIVLINEGSASASEIVAGAISDYNRGKLLGQRTFGKGTVQTVVPLGDGSALRLTTARYYTPSGNFIHEKGIEPDYKIEYDNDDEEDEQKAKAIEILKNEFAKEVLDEVS